MPVTKIVLALALVGVVAGQRSPVANLSSFLKLITALKYNDACSMTNELSRQNLTRDITRLSTNRFASGNLLAIVNQFSNDVVTNNKRFCAAPELLICNKETQRCGCGDPGRAVLFPNVDSSRDYVVERDELGVNRCRWTENTYCLSDDLLRAQGFGNMINSKCRSGTKCITKSSGEECSFHSIIAHVMASTMASGRRGGRLNIQTIMRDVYEGKVCTCQPDPALNAINSEENWWSAESNDIRRRKRSTQLSVLEEIASRQADEQKMSAFAAPVLDIRAFFA